MEASGEPQPCPSTATTTLPRVPHSTKKKKPAKCESDSRTEGSVQTSANPTDFPPAYSGPEGQVSTTVTSVTYAPGPPRTTIAVVPMPPLGSKSQGMVCPSCNSQIVTEIRPKTTTRTHLIAALLCILACWPCAFIPYCMDSCKNLDHYCPHCQAYLGSYKS